MTIRAAFVTLVTLLLVGCSDIPEIDQYFTFNVTRSASYSIPATANNSSGLVTATVINDFSDIEKQGTSTDNLRTAKITRVQLSGEGFNFNSLANARILIGQDTIADSLYSVNGEYLLRARNADALFEMRNGSFPTTLEYSTLSAIADSTKLTANFTITLTALPR
jgi:hypothetical protein